MTIGYIRVNPTVRALVRLLWRDIKKPAEGSLQFYIDKYPELMKLSSQSSAPIIAVLVVAIILLGAVGYGDYSNSTALSSLSQQNTGLNDQLSALSQQNSNLNQQLSDQNQQISNLDGQVGSLGQQVSSLAQETQTVLTMTNDIISIETTTSVQTTTQTSLVTTTQTSTLTSTETSISSVPQSTLIITGDSYSNATYTFTFQVQNTQDYVVYAQLSASLWGQGGTFCNGQVGTFVSQVYTFNPGVTTTTQLNLNLGSYVGFCGGNPLSSIQMNFVVPQSTAVSPTYTFIVVPNYTFP